MFGIFFGWKKASKCKKLIKMLKCRLKLLKSKRCCVMKQLREDVAELIKHGHNQTAFERVEQLIMDERVVRLYDLLDQFCDFIIFHLPYIRKSRDCPNDINEALSSLIFSSARFGELPELMPIRKLFRERYGQRFVTNALELRSGNLVHDQIKEDFYNKEHSSNDLKYKMLAEIASNCMQKGPLFLEYKQESRRAEDGIQYLGTCDPKPPTTPASECEDTDKFAMCRRGERSTSSGNYEMESSSEMIYLDEIEEIVSSIGKDGKLQDQRSFVFKSYGVISKIEYGLEYRKPDTEEKLFDHDQHYGLRAMSMPIEGQPYSRHSSCRHIHPKLPDYDELAAKFKALKIAKHSE